MDVPYQQLRILEEELHIAEEDCRLAMTTECDFDEETVTAMIKQARLDPQTNTRLQRIHEVYKALMTAKQQWARSTRSRTRHRVRRELVKKTE